MFEVSWKRLWSSSSRNGDDEWNEAWESAWLPENLTAKTRAPWESDVNFPSSSASASSLDAETKAFVEDMNENWEERRKRTSKEKENKVDQNGALYSLENMKKDYRLKKQRVHAGLWVKEIEKMEEAKLADGTVGDAGGGDIQRLLDSCSEYVPSLLFVKMPLTHRFPFSSFLMLVHYVMLSNWILN